MGKMNAKSTEKEDTKQKPVHKVRVGSTTASVWANKNDDKTSYSVSFEKSYKDDKDEWQTSTSYFTGDLLSISKAADLAHTFILEQYENNSN